MRPNRTGFRVYVSTRLQPPKIPLALVYETRRRIPRTLVLMIAYERLELRALADVPVLAYDMSEPFGDRGFAFVPPLPNPDTCKHSWSADGYCRKCWKEVS